MRKRRPHPCMIAAGRRRSRPRYSASLSRTWLPASRSRARVKAEPPPLRQATWLVDDGEMWFLGCEAIHASGLMIGTRQTFQDYLLHAFVWTSPTVAYDLRVLLRGQQSWGCCVSDTLWMAGTVQTPDRKSTRLNSSHLGIS